MTARECPRFDDAAAWVLGMLPAAEAREFAYHLATCALCTEEVRRHDEPALALADALATAPPEPALRERLLAGIEAETRLLQAAQAPDESAAPRSPRRMAAVAAAALAVLAGGIVVGRALPRDDGGAVTTVAGTAGASVVRDDDRADLVLRGLTSPPEGRLYQAWIVRDGETVATNRLFSVGPSGDTRISLPSLDHVQKVIVTAEEPDGSLTPTLPAVVEVTLPS